MFAAVLCGIVMINGCSAPMPKEVEGETIIPVQQDMPTKKVQHLITQAGQQAGWMMTPLNSRAIVASKYIDGESASVVLRYDGEHIIIEKNRTTMSDSAFEDEVEELQEAIADSL